ncbi:phage tail spike protein [Paraclostridium sordellii]|uniref:phage tail spike protein n=1 Tax=Paraclostridium sordellii TaxID=1505 RepID=UPI0005DE75CE|nr:phage tail spike protein [Paeniclostridium sordellii]CEN87344.1 phage minor structural protein [[Clostridium] sordellii] [Paeniclostridium sordellii]
MSNRKIVKVCIFNQNANPDEVIYSNGDKILDNIIIEAKTDEHLLTGEYYLDLVSLIDKEGLHESLIEEAIIKVQLDYGNEYFRIAKVNRSSRDVKVFARQITISEMLDMWIEDTRPTDTSGQGALSILRQKSIGKKDIQLFSDIEKINTAYYMKMNVYQAIYDCDQSFINRWGGETLRRGYTVSLNKRIGADRGVQIRSRKNLTGFEAKTDIDNVCTRIKPTGFDGITIDGYIDSPLIKKYSAVKTKEIKYESVKVRDEKNPDEGFKTLKEAQEELKRLAKLEFTQKHIDELRASYKINFVQLEYTEEYKNYVQAERVYLGDTVNVYEEKHKVHVNVRCIRKKYDVLRQRTIEIELSNTDISQKSITTSDILAELNSIIKDTKNNNVQDIIQSMINSGIKDSYVIPRQNEIIVADNKDLNLAQNVVKLNKNGLAFSQTGYYGKYSYGFTINGVINASLIATGILSTIMIQNRDGSLQIDLSGTNGVKFLKNGIKAVELAGNMLKFYDWDGIGKHIGEIFSGRITGTEIPGIILSNSTDGYSGIAYEDKNTSNSYPFYIKFDKYNLTGNAPYPIMVYEKMCMNGWGLVLDKDGLNEIYRSTDGNNFINKATNYWGVIGSNLKWKMKLGNESFWLYDLNTDAAYFNSSPYETYFAGRDYKYASFKSGHCKLWDGSQIYASFSTENGFSFWKNGNDALFTSTTNNLVSKLKFYADNGIHVNGDFTVNGNKNCVQKTKHYGERLFYSVEDCESYLTDRGMHLLTVDEVKHNNNKVTYERVVLLDNIFKDSVNLDLDYTVEIIKQGWGDYRIKEQTKDYFIVESDRKDFTFKYVVTAKRQGFEEERNKEVFLDALKENDLNNNIIENKEYWRLYTEKEGDSIGSK